MPRHATSPPFASLICLAIFANFLSWVLTKPGEAWLAPFLANAGTSVLTSLLIIYTYDLLISKRIEKERAEREIRALSGIVSKLRQHYRVLLNCYRSACDCTTAPVFPDANEFLGPQYLPVVIKLDLYARSPENSTGNTPYYQYIQHSFEELHQALSSFLLLSGPDLSQEVFLATQRVLNDKFMLVAKSLSSICQLQLQGSWGSIQSQLLANLMAGIDTHCAAFAQLLSAVDRVHPHNLREYRIEEWHNDFFLPGHARIR